MVGPQTLDLCIMVRIHAPKHIRRDAIFMSYFVYILQCSDQTYYVGCTNNLEKRLTEHNTSKRGAHYTKIRRPVVLKYKEEYTNLRDARRREVVFKAWPRGKKQALINKTRLSLKVPQRLFE